MPAPAVLREAERRRQQAAGRALGAQVGGRRTLAGVLRERGLRIEQVHLRRAARHEQQDVVLRARREVRPDGVHGSAKGVARAADRQGRAMPNPPHMRPQRFATRDRLIHGQKIISLVASSACA